MRRREKLRPTTNLRFRAYTIIEQAVEEGVEMGWYRGYKYDDDATPEAVRLDIVEEVMNALCEVMAFDAEAE